MVGPPRHRARSSSPSGSPKLFTLRLRVPTTYLSLRTAYLVGPVAGGAPEAVRGNFLELSGNRLALMLC
jgi:hypothetical protein